MKDSHDRRAAIQKGLRCLPLDEGQMRRALTLWDQLFAVDHPNAVSNYVDTLAALLRLSDKDRHSAQMSILREMISRSLDLRSTLGHGRPAPA
jgi:hypothetical protein